MNTYIGFPFEDKEIDAVCGYSDSVIEFLSFEREDEGCRLRLKINGEERISTHTYFIDSKNIYGDPSEWQNGGKEKILKDVLRNALFGGYLV